MRFRMTQRDVVRGTIIRENKDGTETPVADRPQGRLVRKGDMVELDDVAFYRKKSMQPANGDQEAVKAWLEQHAKPEPAPEPEPAPKRKGRRKSEPQAVTVTDESLTDQ